jgi:transcriptional regulator with XRE-family HTH domain
MPEAPRRVARTGQLVRGPDKLEIDAILATFGQGLKSRRKTAGLTQEALAHQTFLRPKQVSLFERGKAEPHLTVLLMLAHALDVTASQLLDGLVLAPTRQASIKRILELVGATPGVSTDELADTLRLPGWYVNQNARRMQALGAIRWDRKGWMPEDPKSPSTPSNAGD